MARPGIMLYFDILEPIRVLPDADKGRLLVAMLEYGEYGTVPQFDGMLALAWGFIRPKLDRDEGSYENAKLQRKYAAFCKKRAGLNLPKIPFEEWLDMPEDERQRMVTTDNEPQRPVDSVNGRYPTTTAAATSTVTPTAAVTLSPSSTVTPKSTAAAAGTEFAAATAEQREMRMMGGELGKGVVLLSQDQTDDLLDLLGIDAFDYYVDKLSSFIIKNNAKVANHYETILKWWREDSGLENR